MTPWPRCGKGPSGALDGMDVVIFGTFRGTEWDLSYSEMVLTIKGVGGGALRLAEKHGHHLGSYHHMPDVIDCLHCGPYFQ